MDSNLNLILNENKTLRDNSPINFENFSLNSSISSQNLLTKSRQVRAEFHELKNTRGKVISKSRSPIELHKTLCTVNDVYMNKTIKRSASERVQGEKNRHGIELIKGQN